MMFGLIFVEKDDRTFTFTENFVSVDISFYRSWSSLTVNDIAIDCSLKVGEIICNFLIIGVIGRGSYGKIYLCKDVNTGEYCAAKLQDEKSHTSELEKLSIARGCQNIPSVSHTILFSVLGEMHGCFFMTYCSNGTLLQHHVKSKSIDTLELIQKLMQKLPQLIRALIYIHDLGLVHGDIKPDNILVYADETLKLCDYGITQILPEGFRIEYGGQEVYSRDFKCPLSWQQKRTGSKKFSYCGPSDLWTAFLSFIAVASDNKYYQTRFSVLRHGDYDHPESQRDIDSMIDSIVFGPHLIMFANFFKKYLNLSRFWETYHLIIENPNSEVSIENDALRELESLLGISKEPGACYQEQQITPLRPRHEIISQLPSILQELELGSIQNEEEEEKESLLTDEEDKESP